MYATRYGRSAAPAVAIVGTWDPFLPVHQELSQTLVRDAHARGLAAAAILLHPNPYRFIVGADAAPAYDDLHTRIWQMRRCGVDAVLKVQLRRRDVDLGAAEFFDVVTPALTIAELWLGARQSFGRGAGGSQQAIEEQAERRGIRLCILPEAPTGIKFSRHSIERLLASGHLTEAIHQVGHPPIWRRPRSGRLRLAWQPGSYQVVPLPSLGAPLTAAPLRVTLAADRALPVLHWPETDARYLAFVTGPQDAAAPFGLEPVRAKPDGGRPELQSPASRPGDQERAAVL